MLSEPNKDENQDQPGAPTAPAEVPEPTDADKDVAPLLRGTLDLQDQIQQQGTEWEGARAASGVDQTDPKDAVVSSSPDSAPDAQGEGDGPLPGGGQTEQNPVSAAETDMPQDEASSGVEDPFTVTDESEEDKRLHARAMAAYDEYLGRGDIREPGDGPDVPDLEPDSPELECAYYEPPSTLELIRQGQEIEVARIEWRGLRPTLTLVSNNYQVPSMSSAVYRSIHLPKGVADYQSAREVFDAVYAVLQNCSALSRQQCELLTFWCIATWFQGSLDYLPRVTISGPWYAADLLFSLLNYVCHQAIQVVDISSAVLKGTSMEQLCPTLLIHQVKASKMAKQVLDATDYPGYIFARAGEVRQFCCPKVLYIGETCEHEQAASGLHIRLGRNASVPMRPYRSAADVDRLQSRLLSYYAFNRARTKFLEVPPGELPAEFDLIARRLGAVIINDSTLQRRLVELLKGWSEDVRAERGGGIEATVLTSALSLAHGNEPRAHVQEVAAGAKQISKGEGELLKLSNEKVGHLLRKLGLRTHRDMKGRALVFDPPTQLLLHQLCLEYDVLPAAPQCGYCHTLQTQESK
jgi:hypothetical protein